MKKHDIVETSKMSMEYNGALIDVERTAAVDLDNGRLVVRDGDTYKYPADATVTELFLVHTPEKTYENVPLTEFYNKEGKKIRVSRIMIGDIFGTTSAVGAKKDDLLMVDSAGKLIKNVAGVVEFKVKEIRSIGGFPLTVVERIKQSHNTQL